MYAQIVGYGSEGVSRVKFERVYLRLVEMLEDERMELRREKLIRSENGAQQKGITI